MDKVLVLSLIGLFLLGSIGIYYEYQSDHNCPKITRTTYIDYVDEITNEKAGGKTIVSEIEDCSYR